ncbi:MAG: chorismate synthase [Planctomycetes bacterium]|nr:chorismate synthase [Planctomycetota bacterium]
MAGFSFRSAGESHGEAILAFLEGVPFGLELDVPAIDAELRRRQGGPGRSARMNIEQDRAEVVAGVYRGRTSGAPLVLRIANADRSLERLPPLHRPRPGHADLAGAQRFATSDVRPVVERASARETAARVAAGAVARQVLRPLGVEVAAFVLSIGGSEPAEVPLDFVAAVKRRDLSDLRTPDAAKEEAMRQRIEAACRAGDTVGGTFLVCAEGVPAGLGSVEQWTSRLDARLAAAMMSIPSVKGVEIGEGFGNASRLGSEVHDPIHGVSGEKLFARPSNRAGGLEGGMSNGEAIWLRVAMKPLSTLRNPLETVDLRDGMAGSPEPQRSDVCAVPAGSVVGEAMMLIVLAQVFLERFGGATIEDLSAAVRQQSEHRKQRFFVEGHSPGS